MAEYNYVMKLAIIFLCVAVMAPGIRAACSFDAETGESFCDEYTQWQSEGDKSQISWANNCSFEFDGDKKKIDLKTVPSVSDRTKCGQLCLLEEKCTHFTFTTGSCFMKSNIRELAEEPTKTKGSDCGYINTRTDFNRVG